MTLYFLGDDTHEHKVRDVEIEKHSLIQIEDILKAVHEDLKERKPELKTNYTRCWWDDYDRMWIDFGSHTEFYVVHEEASTSELGEGGVHEEATHEDNN